MTLFKVKKTKKRDKKKRTTIDAIHQNKLFEIGKQKKVLPKLKKKLDTIEKKINDLENQGKVNLSDEDLEKFFDLKEESKKVKEKIKEIEENKIENDYFLDNGHLLFQYYETKNKGANKKQRKKTIKKTIEKNSVIDFFSKSMSQEQNSQLQDKQENLENQQECSKYNSMNKIEILNTYMHHIDKNYIIDINKKTNSQQILYRCEQCDIEKYIHKSLGLAICPKCSNQEKIIIESDKPSYKDPPKEIAYFSYKRINHFNEWLAQFQAKESTEIPSEVYDKIILEIEKERIHNMVNLTPIKLREILKKLKLNKYYEHVPHIINRLNGVQAPTMSREMEEKLRSMFKEIQAPFMKYCPKDRKNFLSYSYVLHKFVELLELDEFLPNFPLLKSREKLHQQDKIWKKVCEDLGWEFYKSL